MKLFRQTLVAACLLLGTVAAGWSQASPFLRGEYVIPNLGSVKNQIRDYVKSGQYREEVAYVTTRAKSYLESRLALPMEGKPAMVFDIDETCISNYGHIEEMDFAFQPNSWNAWVNKASAPAIEGTLDLYRFARARGVAIIFISGRNLMQRVQTENNLRQVGFEDWTELVLKEPNSQETTESFKTSHRRRLSQAGFRILLNLGDQDSDLGGGYSEANFKLPNPLYWVP